MLTPEQAAAIRAKPEGERTEEEVQALAEFDAAEKKKAAGEHQIPKSRLDAEIAKRTAAEVELAALRQKNADDERKRLEEQNNFKALYETARIENETLKQKAASIDSYESTLHNVLESEIALIPEAKRALVPEELSTQQKLSWISKNRALLVAPAPPNVGAGQRGGSDTNTSEMTDEEKAIAKNYGIPEAEYQKYSDPK